METVAFTPTREFLLKRPAPVPCTEPGCSDIFDSDSHLNMHLAKRHGMMNLLRKSDLKKIYHCPEPPCSYNSKLHFKQLKLLKQHYAKVHAEKRFVCRPCGRSFSVASALKYHAEYCGTAFKCSECRASYACYESLQTHCRRKKHKLLAKTAYKAAVAKEGAAGAGRGPKTLLPKGAHTYVVLFAAKQGSDKSCQTEAEITQICAETQTSGPKPPGSHSDRITTETHAQQTQPETKSRNTSPKLTLADFGGGGDGQQRNSNTLMDFDPAFFNCNTETQTDLFSDALLDSCDFYTNMYTQTPTCGDMLLDDLEFNDTYTETVLYEDMRSVESQTMLYNNYKKGGMLCRDVANIETQTDLEVKQILEEMD